MTEVIIDQDLLSDDSDRIELARLGALAAVVAQLLIYLREKLFHRTYLLNARF